MAWAQWLYLIMVWGAVLFNLWRALTYSQTIHLTASEMRRAYWHIVIGHIISFIILVFAGAFNTIF